MKTQCCIAGGGPAGMMLGFLLARAGVEVVVLEKHADFLRDFRGDTIHPSTLELMYELGILEEFLQRPHQEVTHLKGWVGDREVTVGDFSHLPTHCRFLAFMPQWEFLDFIAEEGRKYLGFRVMMRAEVTDLIEENGRVAGVHVKTPEGELEIQAALTVGADGRRSVVRDRAGLSVLRLGAPMDVLWLRLSRKSSDPSAVFGRFQTGRILVLLDREDYWQIAYVIAKDTADEMRKKDIAGFREEIARLVPFLRDRVDELRDWKDVSLLTVAVDRLVRWYKPGLLCIGDAAHAMSPIGGVGINLAIQDAVAAANILAEKLRRGDAPEEDLEAVQRRREFPTRAMQWLQVAIQNNVIVRVLGSDKPLKLPLVLNLLNKFPYLRRIPARVIGMGFRPEHVARNRP